jgi:hypothetical protein
MLHNSSMLEGIGEINETYDDSSPEYLQKYNFNHTISESGSPLKKWLKEEKA